MVRVEPPDHRNPGRAPAGFDLVPGPPPAISVIVPTWNEETALERCLQSIHRAGEGIEAVVVDGGSRDDTLRRAEAGGARIVRSRRGRGIQMNAGAEAARADILLFLHADVELPPEGLARAMQALARDDVVGACFRLRFDHRHPLLALYGALTRLPFGWLRFGDQGLAVRRRDFETLGGFRELPLMEDVELMGRLRRLGRIQVMDCTARASARRFQRRGIVRQQFLNAGLLVLFWCGVSPERLARWYDRD